MFQNQHGSLVAALTSAGISRNAATQIARILSNPKQTLRTGPIEQDTTPENMRFVRRQDKLTLPEIDFRESDADYRAKRQPEGEERPLPEQAPAVQSNAAPQVSATSIGVAPGPYISVDPAGKSAKVRLNLTGENNGIPVVNTATQTMVSKDIDAQSDANGLRFFIERNQRQLIWKLMFDPEQAEGVDVVTDVSLDATGIVVKKRTIYPSSIGGEFVAGTIDVEECP